MKSLLISLLVVTAGVAHAQQGGTVVFGNNNSSPITISQNGPPVKASDGVKAALYWAPTNSSTFMKIDPPVNVGVLTVQSQVVPLDGIFAGGTRTAGPETPGGSPAQFQVRAWSGPYTSYEQAAASGDTNVLVGQSAIFQASTGNPAGAPPTPPAALAALQGFALAPNTVSTPATASAGGNQTICAGSSTSPLGGSVGGGATGGTWSSSGTGTFSPGATTLNAMYNPSPADVAAGTVTLTLTSSGQLPSATAQVVVTINPALTVTAGSDQSVCANNPAVLGGNPTASGGTGPYTFGWSPTTGLSDPTAANPTATVGSDRTYTVRVTDSKGCTGTASVVLTVATRLSHRFYRVFLVSSLKIGQGIAVPSPPVITSIRVSGTSVTLVWTSVQNSSYRLQYKNNLTDATWADLPGDVVASGPTATKTDIILAGGCP